MFELLLYIVTGVLIFQIILFFVNRNRNKKDTRSSILKRYNIHSAKDAWNLINDPSIPDADKEEIEVHYRSMIRN